MNASLRILCDIIRTNIWWMEKLSKQTFPDDFIRHLPCQHLGFKALSSLCKKTCKSSQKKNSF